jgi:hypothetical protein
MIAVDYNEYIFVIEFLFNFMSICRQSCPPPKQEMGTYFAKIS